MHQAQPTPFPYETVELSNGLRFELVKIEKGTLILEDARKINISEFYLGKYPVTVKEYLTFVKATGNHYPDWMEEGSDYNIHTGTDDYYKKMENALTHDQHPIVGVNWHNAVAYCEWLSQETGQSFQLPSETQWEYAARGGKYSQGFKYAGGNQLKEVGWYGQNSHGETKPVGLKQPNELGLYDMSGNVWEWCADHWHDNYKDAPQDGSAWEEGGDKDLRVLRGGSWNFDDINCRVSFRNGLGAVYRNLDFGFRVSRY